MNKEDLRTRYRQKRKDLSSTACAALNIQLYNRFFSSVDLSFIHIFHTYLPINEQHEPDTWMILDRVRREFPHVRISVPRVTAAGNLEHFYFEGLHQLQTNAWGIQEPRQGVPTPIEKIDLVLVPLLCFDRHGHRVGYGKGYYDRFLTRCRPACNKVGLSFFEAEDPIENMESTDVQLNTCITPDKTYSFLL